MVNYGARLEGPLDMVMLPMTVKDSSKRRVDVIVVQPWMSRLNFVQPGFRVRSVLEFYWFIVKWHVIL